VQQAADVSLAKIDFECLITFIIDAWYQTQAK
jgi:hypothetical protein